MAKLESRDKIKNDIQNRQNDLKKRGDTMNSVVHDKKNIADTSKRLLLATTTEGAEQLKKAIKKAAEAANHEFEKQNRVLENKFGECKKAEGDLQKRTENAKHDTSESRKAASSIKETAQARAHAVEAAKAAEGDAKFTDEHKNIQKKHHETSKALRDRQQNAINNARLAF
jgi:hypothetical protein